MHKPRPGEGSGRGSFGPLSPARGIMRTFRPPKWPEILWHYDSIDQMDRAV